METIVAPLRFGGYPVLARNSFFGCLDLPALQLSVEQLTAGALDRLTLETFTASSLRARAE